MNPSDACYSYLMAFAYWAGIAFASLILLMIFHATHARWMTVLRRPIEAMARVGAASSSCCSSRSSSG